MIPLQVVLKGFMSYRDEQALSFADTPLLILSGDNGSGKSTVFDAISFALYGCTRAERGDGVHLINHDCSQMMIRYDFAVDDGVFRIERTLTRTFAKNREERAPRSTRQAWQRRSAGEQSTDPAADPAWQPVDGTEREEGLRAFRRRVFGIEYEAFTASVLLLQGQSEKLLDAEPGKRREILAELLGLSRFQLLHEKVDDRRKLHQARRDRVEHDLLRAPEISQESMENAAALQEQAAARCTTLEAERQTLVETLVHARHWQDWFAERVALEERLRQGLAVLQRAAEIRIAYERWRELSPVVGVLEDLVRQGADAARRRQEAEALAAELGAQDLCAARETTVRLQRDEALLGAQGEALREEEAQLGRDLLRVQGLAERWRRATELLTRCEALAKERAAAPVDLEERLQQEETAARDARDAMVAARTEAEQAQQAVQRFEGAVDAPTCTLCLQPIAPGHAAREREKLSAALVAAKERLTRAEEMLREVGARPALQGLRAQVQKLQRCHQALERDQGDLSRLFGETPRAELEQGSAEQGLLRERQTELLGRVAHCTAELRRVRGELRQAQGRLEKDVALRETRERERVGHQAAADAIEHNRRAALQLLPEAGSAWRERALSITAAEVAGLREEERALVQYERLYAELQEAQRGGLEEQIAALTARMDGTPEGARRPASEVDVALQKAGEHLQRSRGDESRFGRDLQGLRDAHQRRQGLAAELDAAAAESGLYERLSKLLGPRGLQRWLIQQAEAGIVQHANEALDGLTRGKLYLKLQQDEDSRKALDLLVYNRQTSDRPMPIALCSGSQRFRVAISLALATGRYLSQQARRVESVIIDEGFGSLDQAGRAETIEMLKALRSQLARIILVSHQEEFARSFTRGYRIELRDRSSVAVPLAEV